MDSSRLFSSGGRIRTDVRQPADLSPGSELIQNIFTNKFPSLEAFQLLFSVHGLCFGGKRLGIDYFPGPEIDSPTFRSELIVRKYAFLQISSKPDIDFIIG